MANRLGVKFVMLGAVFSSSFFTLLAPTLARLGYVWLVVGRALQGFFEAPFFPSLYVTVSTWLPKQQKSFYLSAILTGDCEINLVTCLWIVIAKTLPGSAIGAVFSSVVNGLLCSYAGWEWAFYVPGIMGMTWCVLYFFLVHTDIESHPRMSQVSPEAKYLMAGSNLSLCP